jgi:spermidine synthase
MIEQMDWVDEKWDNVHVSYKVKEILKDMKTNFQHFLLVDTFQYGKMLLIDGMVQTTEKDEFIYHEMMTHVPLTSHSNPSCVLIIGGGDGGVLREVLKHVVVDKATLVEIDPMIIDICKKHLPSISDGAFDDPRTELIIDDGFDFVKNTTDQFDIVIVDSPDPIGPAKILFTKEFYKGISRILKPGGIMARQTGSLHMQNQEQIQVNGLLYDIFKYRAFYVYGVPTYIGGLFSSIFCSDSYDPMTLDIETVLKNYNSRKLKTKYYSPGLHLGAFHVPRFLEENFK